MTCVCAGTSHLCIDGCVQAQVAAEDTARKAAHKTADKAASARDAVVNKGKGMHAMLDKLSRLAHAFVLMEPSSECCKYCVAPAAVCDVDYNSMSDCKATLKHSVFDGLSTHPEAGGFICKLPIMFGFQCVNAA